MPSPYLPTQPTQLTTQVVMAQQFNQDVMGDIGKGLTHFYESGQLWAALIGAAVGYIFKSVI